MRAGEGLKAGHPSGADGVGAVLQPIAQLDAHLPLSAHSLAYVHVRSCLLRVREREARV
jgi:hypothetical protein